MHGTDYIREYLVYAYLIYIQDEQFAFASIFDGVIEDMLRNWKSATSPYKLLVSYADVKEGLFFLTDKDFPDNIKKEAMERLDDWYMVRSGGICGCY